MKIYTIARQFDFLEVLIILFNFVITGTREQAWVYALTSAALTRAVARGCSSGILKQCACGSFPRHPPDGQFKWGGCGDDIKYGNYEIIELHSTFLLE